MTDSIVEFLASFQLFMRDKHFCSKFLFDSNLNVAFENNLSLAYTGTDVDRTLMSVESNLAGLFPPSSTQIWDTDIRWQPVPAS